MVLTLTAVETLSVAFSLDFRTMFLLCSLSLSGGREAGRNRWDEGLALLDHRLPARVVRVSNRAPLRKDVQQPKPSVALVGRRLRYRCT